MTGARPPHRGPGRGAPPVPTSFARLLAASAFATIGLLIGPSRSAEACDCEPEKLSLSVKNAKTVFRGRIVVTTRTTPTPDTCKPDGTSCWFEYTYEVRVLGVWKGKLTSKVIIDGGSGGGECTLGKIDDTVEWVFITDSDGAQPISVHSCGGSSPALKRKVAEITKLLGAPRRPSK